MEGEQNEIHYRPFFSPILNTESEYKVSHCFRHKVKIDFTAGADCVQIGKTRTNICRQLWIKPQFDKMMLVLNVASKWDKLSGVRA